MVSQLSQDEHQAMVRLGIDFRQGTDVSKQVFIRDEAARHLSKFMLKMRLHPREVGIHPRNRDRSGITPRGVWIRGGKILASGFSFAAMGTLYAFEDHPNKQHIAKYTVEKTKSDQFGNFDISEVRVGAANWTHSNQFTRQVECRSKCTDANIPCIDGQIDSGKILQDPRNIRLSEYIEKGVIWNVFPHWVEEAYPWMPDAFQSADNQVQQIQEGSGFSDVYKSSVFFVCFVFTENPPIRPDPIRPSGPTRSDPIRPDPALSGFFF